MRKITLVLLCALILAECVMLYGLYGQYEAMAAEKIALERRAGVLKTLLEQTEKELAVETEKWQAEKQTLLATQKETAKTAEETPAAAAILSQGGMDYSHWLQGIYARLFSGSQGETGEETSIFQMTEPEESPAPTETPTPAGSSTPFPLPKPLREIIPIPVQMQ